MTTYIADSSDWDGCLLCSVQISHWLTLINETTKGSPPPLFVITTVPAQTLQQFGHQATCN